MVYRHAIKTGLLGSVVFLTATLGANASDLPKNSLDLARWAQVVNTQSKARLSMPTPARGYTPKPINYSNYAAPVNPVTLPNVLGGPAGARALYNPSQYAFGSANFSCVKQAAFDHQVPLRFMLAINSIERGRYNQKVANKGAVSHDLGQFQINTIHLPVFARFGAGEYDLLNRGCYNAQAAAYLLSNALKEPSKRHLDIFTRAAGYHSWTPKYNSIYKKKLIGYLKEWDVWLRVNNIPDSGFA